MARSIQLPARANALVYGDAEVIDVLLTLHNTEQGNAVVIDDATDTEPKARVRCRAMAKLLEAERTVTVDDLPESGEFTPEWMTEQFDDVTPDKPKDAPQAWAVPGIAVRTHVVPEGEGYLPVLSPKQ